MDKNNVYLASKPRYEILDSEAFSLLMQELRGCDAEILFKLTGEVLGIFEAETFSSFGDGGALKQERLGTLHNEVADVGGSRLSFLVYLF